MGDKDGQRFDRGMPNSPPMITRAMTEATTKAISQIDPPQDRPWWKDVVCYQVWPMSFKDSNGDGHGDIKGVISKLDYLKDFGIDCIWISPTYASPMKDWGYDISDYTAIHPHFGTLTDMEALIQACHDRGMRILMDLVVTHTSNEHPWFKESSSDSKNNKKDWYIWADKRPGNMIDGDLVEEPSNWKAAFGGSAWTEVKTRNQYYIHLFLEEQPDLNWECQEMKDALFETAIKFWLDRDVDGFRIDTANRFSKHPDFPDIYPRTLPNSRLQPGSEHYINGPKMHDYLKEMRQYIDRYAHRDPMLLGELPLTTEDEAMRYVHPDNHELSMIFDFDMVKLGNNDNPDEFDKHEVMNLCDGDDSYTLPKFKQTIMKVQRMICERGAWGTLFMENHDQPRCIARYATPKSEYWRIAGKLLALLQTTLTGTLFLFQGQEIGMMNMPTNWNMHEFRDPDAKIYLTDYKTAHAAEDANAELKALQGIYKVGRDNSRTPMQWDSTANGGFTGDNPPWMKANENKDYINVAAQQRDPKSIWNFWKQMIKFRKDKRELFMHGSFACHDIENPKTFAYTKMSADGEHAFVILNFSEEIQEFSMTHRHLLGNRPRLIVSNRTEPDEDLEERTFIPLQAWEGRLYMFGESAPPQMDSITVGPAEVSAVNGCGRSDDTPCSTIEVSSPEYTEASSPEFTEAEISREYACDEPLDEPATAMLFC